MPVTLSRAQLAVSKSQAGSKPSRFTGVVHSGSPWTWGVGCWDEDGEFKTSLSHIESSRPACTRKCDPASKVQEHTNNSRQHTYTCNSHKGMWLLSLGGEYHSICSMVLLSVRFRHFSACISPAAWAAPFPATTCLFRLKFKSLKSK